MLLRMKVQKRTADCTKNTVTMTIIEEKRSMWTPTQAKQAIGQTFTLSSDSLPPHPLILENVTLSERRNTPSHFREAFSMLLTGTKGRYCPQGTYRLEHATLGTLEVFIVPIAHHAERDEYTYELIFN